MENWDKIHLKLDQMIDQEVIESQPPKTIPISKRNKFHV
jgi:hypothetical protein